MSKKQKNKKIQNKIISIIAVLIIAVIVYISPDFAKTIGIVKKAESNVVENAIKYTDSAEVTKADIQKDKLNIIFFYVGQADSSLIMAYDKTMLIDAGNNEDGKNIAKYIHELGINKIDYVVGTHSDEDHIGGLDDIIDSFEIGKIFMSKNGTEKVNYQNVIKAANKKNIEVVKPNRGDKFTFKSNDSKTEAEFEVMLALSGEDISSNNSSIVLKLQYENTSYLFMGDAEREVEKQLYDCRADVVKVGHHGSSTSSSPDFIARTDAKYAVVSVGEGNSYGHPHKETLTAWQNAGATVLRTDQLGTIVIGSNGTLVTALGGGGVISSDAVTSSKDEPDNQSSKAQYKYVLNISSKKIHLPSCSAVTDMNAENRQYTSKTLNELLAEGYSACGNCKPS